MAKRHVICLIMLGLFGCAQETTITKITEAQTKLPANSSTLLSETKVEAPVKVVGDFSNVQDDGEHQWGYSVALWRQEDKIYGLISGGEVLRLIGDPPIGLLENVQLDPKSKKLSFRARVSSDLYEFEGFLTSKIIKGKIAVTNSLCANDCPKPKNITFRLSEDMTSTMQEYRSYKEWKEIADEVIKRRVTNLESSDPRPIPESPVKPVGHFTNGGSNGEHRWGFYVELWRQEDKIYGLISGREGTSLIGSRLNSILEDVVFDPKTQKISFTATLSGTNFNGTALPSDVYKFEGILTKKKLAGNQTIVDGSCPETCAEKKKITLLRSKDMSSSMEESNNFSSYQEWKAWIDSIL